MSFTSLSLNKAVLLALTEQQYHTPTPIQQQAIPHIMKGRDILGCAQTGTGKTAAFALPVIHRLMENHRKNSGIRALILSPTRELALQIDESFGVYAKHTPLKHTVVFGGVSQNGQLNALRKNPEILTATPGRLLDLISQGFIRLDKIECFVLDEADRMLDMGFINDVKRITRLLPGKRQTLLFSATMPSEIRKLADQLLSHAVFVEVAQKGATVDAIEQHLYFTPKKEKTITLLRLIQEQNIHNALVFTRTKHGADKVVRFLHKASVRAAAIHGNKSQNARQTALNDFKTGKVDILVATDIASRGIDIDELSHVFNYDLPNIPETYVHRIGRTGRAGLGGTAIAFCDEEEKNDLRRIEKLISRRIPVSRLAS